jgi:hypothetical protein
VARKNFKGTSAVVSSPAFSTNPSAFTYTLKYRWNGPHSYSLIPPKDRWTFIWDGNTGTVHRGVVLSLSFLDDLPGQSDDGSQVMFHWFSESPPLEGRTRRWALEVAPAQHVQGDPDSLCTVGYYFDRDESSWTEVGLATKTEP